MPSSRPKNSKSAQISDLVFPATFGVSGAIWGWTVVVVVEGVGFDGDGGGGFMEVKSLGGEMKIISFVVLFFSHN